MNQINRKHTWELGMRLHCVPICIVVHEQEMCVFFMLFKCYEVTILMDSTKVFIICVISQYILTLEIGIGEENVKE